MMFQFLIGRLNTELDKSLNCEFYVFQFLIGRLKTENRRRYGNTVGLFQFLIGRLKTRDVIKDIENRNKFQFI